MPSRPHGILIADDDEAIRTMSEFLFREWGFAVWSAANGREAVELYRRHQDVIDVVLLDVQMPGQDGPDILSAIREIDPGVCCCFASGDLGKWTEAELLRCGAVRVFPKPFPCRFPEMIAELANRRHSDEFAGTGRPVAE